MFFHIFDYSNFEGMESENPKKEIVFVDDEYKENGYTDLSFNMDRIKYNSDQYLYCPAGELLCDGDGDLEKVDGGDYELMNGNIGHTYKPLCKVGSTGTLGGQVTCSTNITSDNPNRYKYIDTLGVKKTFKSNDNWDGFIGPYSEYKPIDVSNSLMYVHVPVTGDGMSGSGGYKVESTPCFLYESFDECKKRYFKEKDEEKDEELKCLADNGAETGDPLCCGQEGVLQNTNYNCPSEYPKCIGYKCGETWGKCEKA